MEHFHYWGAQAIAKRLGYRDGRILGWSRYNATNSSSLGDEPLFEAATEQACSVSENECFPAPDAGCSGVAAPTQDSGEEEDIVFNEEADNAP